jgi:aminopeptidase-like protein|tara:strand:- start:2866 stop:4143 length:1278 start_codon:yes stop_codon:yes gene_type:complete
MIGAKIHEFAYDLWPLNRSLTGEGVRNTLERIRNHLPNLVIKSISSGTKAFDWKIPQEWFVKEAYIITPQGEKICDFSKNNLHLLGYSTPFNGKMSLNELKKHLYTIPEQPDAIPYITSYYSERWGFCLSQDEYNNLVDGEYQIKIDSNLFNGELNYGELIIPGKSKKEVFISTYICHPSMANNELSGPTVVTFLGKWLELCEREYTYRIIFIPETIGSIAYLSINHEDLKNNVFAGYNVSCVGDDRAYSYVPSRNGSTISDEIAKHVLKWTDRKFVSYSWLDRGSDERQYCSPGIDLPIASILRTKYGEYPEYHTSLDNLEDVVTAEGLDGGYWAIRKALEIIERNKKFKVTVFCEPQMGKRGLYPTLSTKKSGEEVRLMMDFISLCDGITSLLNIAELLNVPTWDLYDLVDKLLVHELIIAVE